MKKKDWLKIKKYVHFLPKLTNEDRPFIRSYVSNESSISTHRFYPFIKYTLQDSKWKRGRSKGGRHKYRTVKKKGRDIFYANHLDAQVFSYYNHLLSDKLEEVYSKNSVLSNSVTAYRRIEHESLPRNKNSIDFAKELFVNIKSWNEDCVVLCFDVVSFFDNLDHRILKQAWKRLLDSKELPDDHYAVFKNITKFSYVELSELFEEFKEFNVKSRSQKRFTKLESFCKDNSEFRSRILDRRLIKSKKNDDQNENSTRGIPQGSPISSVLSNLYMFEFDKKLSKIADLNGEFYRRYSDDIVYVCKSDRVDVIKRIVLSEFKDELKLEVSKPKLQEFTFRRISPVAQSSSCVVGDKKYTNLKLQYLGFEFDGKRITIKNSAISRFYRKAKRIIRRKANFARRDKYKIENNTAGKTILLYIFKNGMIYSSIHSDTSIEEKINLITKWCYQT